MKSVELTSNGRSIHILVLENEPKQTSLFGLRKALHKYRAWYDAQMAANRHRIEEDARRFHGTVTWEDKA